MAATSDSPTRFRGQPWSNWADFLGRDSPLSDEDDPDKPVPDVMRLPKEDMGLFGLCPETDGFYAVICELCEACVKPQGLINHMELWHKADATDALPPTEPPEKVSNSKSGTSKGGASNRLNVGSVKLRVKRPLTAPCTKLEHGTTNVAEQTTLSDAEKVPHLHSDVQHSASVTNAVPQRPPSQASGSSSSSASMTLLQPVVALTPLSSPTHMSSTPTATKSSSLPTTPTSASSTTAFPSLVMDISSSSFSTPSPCKKRPKVERKCLPVKEREYDPDKHCGVWNGENSKPCTRSLTCKSHPLSMRRAVSGRSKRFDKLLADHRATKDAAIKLVKTISTVPVVLSQSSPQDMDANQALSPLPPGRVGGSMQLDIPASPLPTSLSIPMSSSVITLNSTPLVNSAPNASVSATPFLSTLATTPLPSIPDLTIDTFESQTVPAPALKAPLLSTVSKMRDMSGLGHSPGPPLAQPLVTATTATTTTTVRTPSPLMTVTVPITSGAPAPPQVPITGLISHNISASPQSPGMTPSCAISINTDVDSTCAPVCTPPKDFSASIVPSSQSPVSASTPSISPASAAQGISMLAPIPASSLPHPTHAFQSVHAVQMCNFPALFEDVTWLKNHPRPLAVCSFSGRKVGTLVCNTRRLEVVREGLREALAHGPIRSPLSSDFYGNTGTNHAAGTIKTVLTNICTKGNFLSPSGKIIFPGIGLSNKNHKIPVIPTPSQHNSSATITIPGAIKAALPMPQQLTVKTTLNHNVTCNKDTIKNGQFHVPNILSGSLKRHADSSKSGGNTNSKRTKRKHAQNVNPAEFIGSLLARKNSCLGGRGNHVPLVTVAIANGLTGGSTSSQSDTSESKNILSSRGGVASDSLRTDLPKGMSSSNLNQISDGTTNATNVKAVSPNVQNVRIATTPSTVQLATPQITYLTTGPVTFQQIPVLSSQVISQIQLQSKNSGGSQSIPLKLVSGSGGVSLTTATAATSGRAVVLHQDKDYAPSES